MRGTTAPETMKRDTTRWVGSQGSPLLLAALVSLMTACGGQPESAVAGLGQQTQAMDELTGMRPLGVALEIEDGVAQTLRVRAGQTVYINQLDIRASVASSTDNGVNGLRTAGDFAGLGWGGVKLAEQESELLPGPEGYKRRRFFRDAAWMDVPSFFSVQPVDANGNPTGGAVRLEAGSNKRRRDDDDFFVRRFRAIQWTYDCASLEDCSTASNFLEEALVELRYARTPGKSKTLTLRPNTAKLIVRWSLRPSAPYEVPVEQVANPTYDYGFSIDAQPLTPTRPDGTYAPGTAVSFRLTLKDGSGNRLHPLGSLPTYNEVVFGSNEAGIQYYRAFFDPSATYYRRKHRERMLMSQIIGPAQRIQPIRSIVELGAFVDPSIDVQDIGTLERDGVFAQFRTFPTSYDLFGGAFDPAHAGWAAPVPDSWTYQLPANALPGTYLVTVKGRRTYLGEDVPASKTIEIQVGTANRTVAPLTTGPCNSCHSQGGELVNVLHGSDNRAACSGCHAPLGFELEGPIFVRVHFIHSRSDRYDASLAQCSKCHMTPESIQRTSKAACFSCHKSYNEQHVKQFGPIQSMYVGGGRESFQQCTGSCHNTHPQSGL
jgi:hypothetical protein